MGCGASAPLEITSARPASTTDTAQREHDLAATKLQAAARGKQTRKSVAQRKREDAAATKVQAMQRGRAARSNKHDRRLAAQQQRAATAIQARERGKRARRRDREMAAARATAAAAAVDSEVSENLAAESAEPVASDALTAIAQPESVVAVADVEPRVDAKEEAVSAAASADEAQTEAPTAAAEAAEEAEAREADPADAVSIVDGAAQVSAVDMLHQIHSGTKTCAAFAAQLLDRIDATNSQVNACLEVVGREQLLAQAAAVDAKVAAGEALKPLEGLLMVSKINIDTAGADDHWPRFVCALPKPRAMCCTTRGV